MATFDPAAFPDLLVGLASADDAAVYRLNDQQAIIATTDFFPPIVDDPYDFGQIAAANALSDIYAMGGEVLFAMNLVAFPDNLDIAILGEILRGGAEKVAEAGGVIAGGHSVKDKEPKYGLAVTGIVDPASVMRKGGAMPGDVLLLTKPLGVGVVTTALKQQAVDPDDLAAAVASMKRLNRVAARAAQAVGAHAMTDITGFGLLGHAHEMAAQRAGVAFQFHLGALRLLPGVVKYASTGTFPGGMDNNKQYFSQWVEFGAEVEPLWQDILYTPETSGGLLVAVDPARVAEYLSLCADVAIVGRVLADDLAGNGRIIVTRQEET